MGNAPAQIADGAGDAATRPSGGSTANAPTPPVNHEGRAAAPPTGNTADTTTTRQPTPVPRIHRAPLTANRQAGLASLAANLDGPAATQTQRVLVDVVGPERAGALQPAVTENERALTLAETRYRVGSDDLRAVEQQQLKLFAARSALLRVESEQLVQRVNLHQALGGDFATGT